MCILANWFCLGSVVVCVHVLVCMWKEDGKGSGKEDVIVFFSLIKLEENLIFTFFLVWNWTFFSKQRY